MNQIYKILEQLVQIKSYSGQEKELADFIMVFCQKNNLPVENQDGNIIIKYLVNSQKCLIFNAHLDTVKEEYISAWIYPPFGKKAGVIKDGKLYGLGASDDKASIAVFLFLALEFIKNPSSIDIFFAFVTKEEIDGLGSQSFVSYFKKNYAKSYKDVSAVIGEPTNCDKIEIGHRGNAFIKITTLGQSGHASRPNEIKKHSIEEMVKVISKIKNLEKKIKIEYTDGILGQPSFCLTGIHTNQTSVNKIPESCFSTWDIRTTPNLDKRLISILKKELSNAAKIEFIEKPVSCGLTSPKEKIVKVMEKIIPNLEFTVSPGSNDISFFMQAGIPAITFGPGNKEVIHQENEYVELINIQKALNVYSNLIINY